MSNKWQGTPVPNSGYIENIYFNTDLSVDEVVALANTLEFTDYGDTPVNYVAWVTFPNGDGSGGLTIMNMNGIVAIMYTIVILFVSQEAGVGFVGWNPELSDLITNPLAINSEATDNREKNGITIPVGAENDKLSSLFSTTPFVKAEDKPKYDWLRELFINEAKPALERHSGSKAPSYEETENEAGGITVTIGTAK